MERNSPGFCTFTLVNFTWVFFRAVNSKQHIDMIQSMLLMNVDGLKFLNILT
jgi:D-alanyl-lipoteichoic acid acyltransferase DltB (MBOAT superfamily)